MCVCTYELYEGYEPLLFFASSNFSVTIKFQQTVHACFVLDLY